MEGSKISNGNSGTPSVRKTSAAVNWTKLMKKSSEKQRLIRGKLLCIVAGAGSSFGKAVSNTIFQDGGILPEAMAGSRVLLIDKCAEGLREACNKRMKQTLKSKKIEIETMNVDLSDPTDTKQMLTDIRDKYDRDFEQVFFINNAINLEDTTKKLTEYEDPMEMQRAWNFSITARAYLTAQISQLFCSSKRTAVLIGNNDLSRAAPYLGLNAMASSAFETFGEVFAQENPTVRVVHYVPRRMDTTKTKTLKNECKEETLTENLTRFYAKSKPYTAVDAAKKFINFLSDKSVEHTPGRPYYVLNENND